MLSRRVGIRLVAAVSLGFIANSYAGFFDGPLSSQNGSTQKTTQSVHKGTDPSSMPAPATTQFQAATGGAPTANAPGQAVNGKLPPVVDAEPGPGGASVTSSTSSPAAVSINQNTIQLSQVDRNANGAPVDSVASRSNAAVAVNTNSNSNANANASTNSASTNNVATVAAPDSVDQRLAKVEQQLNNLVSMNMPQQISDLQMQLQQLSGQLQVQEHDVKLLNTQQRSFYQDLDQRIKKLSGASDDGGGNKPATPENGAKPETPTQPSKVDDQHQQALNSLELQDSSAYKKALDLVIKRQYDAAIKSLGQYLNDYPNGAYKDKAHFWLAEIYYLKKSYQQSLAEFSAVIKESPKSPRVPDAKLKIALIHLNSGKTEQAKKELAAVKNQYPNSTAAQLAIIQLKQLDL